MTACSCECAACETFARCDGCGALATWHWPGLSYACDGCLANEDTLDNSPFKPGLTLARPRCADDRRCPLSLCAAELMTPDEEAEFRASCQSREPYWNRDWTVLRLLSLLDAARRERDIWRAAYVQECAMRSRRD